MNKSRWEKIEPILDEALDFQNPKQQERIIQENCNNDEKLYNQVSSLLRSIRQAKKFNFLEVQ